MILRILTAYHDFRWSRLRALGLLGCGLVVAVAVSLCPAQEANDVPVAPKTLGPAPSSPELSAQAMDADLAMLSALENATIAAIAKAEKSVVAISRVRRDRTRGDRGDLGALRMGEPFAFEDPANDPDYVPSLFGSGVVISEDGFIVTCAHVLDDPRKNDYFVWLDHRGYAARVVGIPAKVYAADPFSDLAIIKIDAQGLTPITFGDADNLRKGKFVIALGNPDAIARDGLASASWGMISNLGRISPSEVADNPVLTKDTVHQFGTLIHTDAKLTLGTSGGALVDLRGHMIGLTTSLAAQHGFERSAGFAIATDKLFMRVIQTLKLGKLPEYGFLGIQPEDLRQADRARGLFGARVSVVIPGLPGDQAGLRSDDVIIQVGERPVLNRNDLFRELSQISAGGEVDLLVQRYRPGSRTPSILKLPAELSKKFVGTTRPGFSIHGPADWRGLTVEFATAVPSELTRGGLLSNRRSSPKLAVLTVDPGTPAWTAGLRPGYGILSVDGTPVESPEEFQLAVENSVGDMTIVAIRTGGQAESIVVRDEAGEAR